MASRVQAWLSEPANWGRSLLADAPGGRKRERWSDRMFSSATTLTGLTFGGPWRGRAASLSEQRSIDLDGRSSSKRMLIDQRFITDAPPNWAMATGR